MFPSKIDNRINVLLADDEPPARKRLKTLIEDIPQLNLVYEATNGDEALTGIVQYQPDLVFLDIDMPGASVFKTIPSLKEPPLVIFQTAYSEYAAQAFEIDAVDYLLKPVSRDRFAKAVAKVQELLLPKPGLVDSGQITVKEGDAFRVVNIADIERVTFHDGFSFICISAGEILCEKSLVSLEEQLFEYGFFQVSRTDLVCLTKIVKIHPLFKGQYMVEMKSGSKVTVSRRRSGKLKDLLGSV